jgi:hypothetical protein
MTTLASTNIPVRAGDRDREAAATRLGQALAQGYLDMTEYERRVGAAFAAHTRADLQPLLADLPVDRFRTADRRAACHAGARLSVRLHLAGYVLMAVVVLTVWGAVALSGGPLYFWPVWPIVGAGIGLVAHAVSVRAATRSRPRDRLPVS